MSDTEKSRKATDPFQAAEDAQKAFRDSFDPEAVGRAQAAMGIDPARFQETMRAMTERSAAQSKEAYQRMKSAAAEATRTLESTLENAHGNSLSLSKKAIEAMRTNAELGFSHLERLASAKSIAEVIELQSSYVRQQVETITDQAKEMQVLSQRVAQELLQRGREAAGKASERP